MMLIKIIYFLACYYSFKNVKAMNYWKNRQNILDLENQMELGSGIELNEQEAYANEIILGYKLDELQEGFENPGKFLPSFNFLQTRNQIKDKPTYKLLEKLPKGALLHSHISAATTAEYIYNLTYSENLCACVESETIKFKFFNRKIDNTCDWKLVNESRQNDKNFDIFIKTQISITDIPSTDHNNINSVWKAFQNAFAVNSGIISYKPIFDKFIYEVLQEIYDDNVMYFEFRSGLSKLYDDNKIYTTEEIAKSYINIIEKFKNDNPRFYGAKIIYTKSRQIDNTTLDKRLEMAIKLQNLYPDYIAGFDLVGQEDLGKPLANFVPELLKVSNKIKFFFHAGETNWNGASTDINLIDAVLLNTTRIGHGYAILKHPVIMKLVKERGIALEINPISNQVLKLVSDIRNHPGAVLLNNGYPVVICNDDPAMWGARALSFDWYMTFVGMSSKHSDLRLLKQLAINSIKYSSLSSKDKQELLMRWSSDWNKFIDDIVTNKTFNRN